MNYDEFRQLTETLLPQCLPDKYAGTEIKAVSKHVMNGPDKEGFSLGPIVDGVGVTVSPTYYYSDLYMDFSRQNVDESQIGPWLSDAAAGWFARGEQIAKQYGEYCVNPDPGRIFFEMINKEANYNYLKEVPHRDLLDLSIVYRYYIGSDERGVGSAPVTFDIAERLGMDENQLFETAHDNMPNLFPFQTQWLSEQLGFEHDPEESADMLYISTSERTFGPSAMLYQDVMDEASAKFGGDLYIFPSSIHDLLAVSADAIPKEIAAAMVSEVNKNCVPPDEWLSNTAYFYDAKEKTISLATDPSPLPQSISIENTRPRENTEDMMIEATLPTKRSPKI